MLSCDSSYSIFKSRYQINVILRSALRTDLKKNEGGFLLADVLEILPIEFFLANLQLLAQCKVCEKMTP